MKLAAWAVAVLLVPAVTRAEDVSQVIRDKTRNGGL
jgi:hypothetical protein